MKKLVFELMGPLGLIGAYISVQDGDVAHTVFFMGAAAIFYYRAAKEET